LDGSRGKKENSDENPGDPLRGFPALGSKSERTLAWRRLRVPLKSSDGWTSQTARSAAKRRVLLLPERSSFFLGQRKIHECPKLNRATVERLGREHDEGNGHEQNPGDRLEKLKSEVAYVDLAEAAERVGAKFSGGKLTLKVLGKDFSVDAKGNLFSEIHVNPWVAVPFLSYILYGKGCRFRASGYPSGS
jgi:hypothetical protein